MAAIAKFGTLEMVHKLFEIIEDFRVPYNAAIMMHLLNAIANHDK